MMQQQEISRYHDRRRLCYWTLQKELVVLQILMKSRVGWLGQTEEAQKVVT
jgi:hypothetical protein